MASSGHVGFEGFSPETLAFFAAIRFNNNRVFFEENRDTYEAYVREPLMALAEALAPAVQRIDPQLDVRPARTVARIHRDLRFRKDKTPYKDYMWLGFRRMGESRAETCGFYFDISDQSANWGCGFYHMQPETMQNFRKKLIDEPKRILKIVTNPKLLSRFALMGDTYVRQHQAPEGMDARLAALYPKKGIYAEHHLSQMEDLFRPELVETIAGDFQVLVPLYELFRECMVKRVEAEA